jgi:hypothetical protein
MVVVVGVYLAWAGQAAGGAIEHWGTPWCSWPVQIHGTASPAQAGLVQCYLQALATRDAAELQQVAADIPPVRITKADLEYSADARSGLATATLEPNPNDPFFYGATITYADGVTEDATMMDMIEMGGPEGWRMNIGTVVNSGPPGPPGYPPPTAGPDSS